MENKRVRIVVLNYNQAEYTLSTVNYLLKQNYKNIEIFVVDNASKEIEYQILKNKLPKGIELIKSNTNHGYSKGNNLGCRFPSKLHIDYYLILNNDVIIEDNDFIFKLIKSIEDNLYLNVVAASPIVDTVSSKISIENQIQVRRIVPFIEQLIVNSPFLNKIFYRVFNRYIYKYEMPYLNKYTICESINGAAFLIKGDVFRDNNYLDEGTFLFLEELILGKQLKNNGFKCVLDGFSSIKHLQGVSTKSNKNQYNIKMEFEKINSEIYYFKNYFNVPIWVLFIIRQLRITEMYILSILKVYILK